MRIFQGLLTKYLGSRASRIIQELLGGAIIKHGIRIWIFLNFFIRLFGQKNQLAADS